MAAPSSHMRSAILAVLEAAKQAGVRDLTKTALVKFVYLLDCLHAESHNGETVSGSGWHLNHFGPFAVDLADAIDTFEHQGVIQSRAGTSGGKDFSLYWLGEYPTGPRLSDVGVSGDQERRFNSLVRTLPKDLGDLLDYVYFETSPMAEARKVGDVLDFRPDRYPPLPGPRQHTHIQDQSKIFRLLELNEQMRKKNEARSNNARAWAAHRPIYDSAYMEAMTDTDAEATVVSAPISFAVGIE